MKIYLKLGKKPKNIKDLLLILFSSGNNIKRTNVETYTDQDCTRVQCTSGRFRSFDEVYLIVKTYFPEASIKETLHELLTLDFGLEEPLYLKMTNCVTIKRIVLYYSNEYFVNSIFGNNKYNSEYSWDELLEMLNLTDIRGIKLYVKKYIKGKEIISDKVNSIETLQEHCKDFRLPYALDTKSKLERSQNAFYVLAKVAEIYNEGTILDWNNLDIYKYMPYKYFSHGGGSAVTTSCFWYSDLGGSACLYYKSLRLSEDSYNNFKSFWEDYWDAAGYAAKGAWFEVSEPAEKAGENTWFNKKGYNIYKDPVTDDGTKKSLKGLLQVTDKCECSETAAINCGSKCKDIYVIEECTPEEESQGLLQIIYEDGKFYNQTTLEEIRNKLNN